MEGFGTQFQRWDSTTSAWVTLAGVYDIKPAEKTVGTTDITAHDSPSKYRVYEATLKDNAEATISLNWDDATGNAYDVLDADFEAAVEMNYEIVFPDPSASTFEFLGIITKVGTVTPLDNKMTAEFTFKVIGKVIKTAGPGVIQ